MTGEEGQCIVVKGISCQVKDSECSNNKKEQEVMGEHGMRLA